MEGYLWDENYEKDYLCKPYGEHLFEKFFFLYFRYSIVGNGLLHIACSNPDAGHQNLYVESQFDLNLGFWFIL